MLLLLRHGESTWNKENRFTGWTDVDLSKKGIKEAHQAAHLLIEAGFTFDLAFTSVLKRAIRTLWIVLEDMDLMWIPVVRSWRLNERHYGALQGFNKSETAAEYGESQVMAWRRGYAIRPPSLMSTDPRSSVQDPRYAHLSPTEIPLTESLEDTVHRMLPYWENTICPELSSGKQVLIVAHGNSLRALVKHLDQIPDDEIPELNIPTGIPWIYQLDHDMKPIHRQSLGAYSAP